MTIDEKYDYLYNSEELNIIFNEKLIDESRKCQICTLIASMDSINVEEKMDLIIEAVQYTNFLYKKSKQISVSFLNTLKGQLIVHMQYSIDTKGEEYYDDLRSNVTKEHSKIIYDYDYDLEELNEAYFIDDKCDMIDEINRKLVKICEND